ncbi:NlpC/P60 family protein [Brevibacterium sp. UMB10442]|nr:NlpC/P60 family protein [Brevibacterium sp. UMB10442]
MKTFATSAILVATLVAGTVTPAFALEPNNHVYVLTGNVRDHNVQETKPRKHKEPAPEVKKPNLPAPKAQKPKAQTPAPKPKAPVVARHGAVRKGDTAYVVVSAATLWKSPSSPRKQDAPALQNPAKLDEWNRNMKDRKGLTGRTETQAIYGDPVYVWEVRGAWARVGVNTEPAPGKRRGYEAWVPKRQLAKSPAFKSASKKMTHVVTVKKSRAYVKAEPTKTTGRTKIEVPFNTRLPITNTRNGKARVALPDNRYGWISLKDVKRFDQRKKRPKPKPSQLVKTSRQFVGLKYTWGGTSSYGFDCSGFTYSIYRAHGITIPRDSGPQSKAGRTVSQRSMQPGDLIFFASKRGKGSVYHVGMYIGNGKMIHAPNASRSVEIVKWKSWGGARDFAGVKRFV